VSDLDKVVDWALSLGFATGHADALDDLLEEVGNEIKELHDLNQRLKYENEGVQIKHRVDKEYDLLLAEREKYKDALNAILKYHSIAAGRLINYSVTYMIAKQALK